MNVYVACSWARRADARKVGEELTGLGYYITRPWWEHEAQYDGIRPSVDVVKKLTGFAWEDFDAVKRADIVIALIADGPRDKVTLDAAGCGTFVEVGIALADGKPVILANLDDRTKPPAFRNVFDYLCIRSANWDAALNLLEAHRGIISEARRT